MNALYNIGVRLYGVGERCAALRSPKARRLVHGQATALAEIERLLAGRRADLWVHSASLGEFEQARPLIERYRAERPHDVILLTFFSPSGYEVRRNYAEATAVAYLPLDTPANARRLLDVAQPRMAIFAKYEFWGNFLQELARRHVPTYIISAIFRPRQVFFKPYGGMFRRMLGQFTHIFVQDEASRRLLAGIGIDNVTIAGDTRFDRVAKIANTPAQIANIDAFGDQEHPTIVFGSSWPEDERRYIDWLNANPQVYAIIAPHEMDGDRIPRLLSALAPRGRVMRLSQWEQGTDADCRTLVVDSFGKLSTLYRYADIAYVGGGFGQSIHNINEAAVYGIPVVFGPRYHKFREAYDLLACGGGIACDDVDTQRVDQHLQRLVDDAAGRRTSGQMAGKYIQQSLGATDKIYSQIMQSIGK